MSDWQGGCGCDAVRYRLEDAPLFVHCCHCRDCQRQTGTAFVLNALIESDRLTHLSGSLRKITMPTESGRPHHIFRCELCQTALWSEYGGGGDKIKFIRVGTLDRRDSAPPNVHIYTRSKLPWVLLPKDVPVFEAFYDKNKFWPSAALARAKRLFSEGDEG